MVLDARGYKSSPGRFKLMMARTKMLTSEVSARTGVSVRMLQHYKNGNYPIPYLVQYAVEELVSGE